MSEPRMFVVVNGFGYINTIDQLLRDRVYMEARAARPPYITRYWLAMELVHE